MLRSLSFFLSLFLLIGCSESFPDKLDYKVFTEKGIAIQGYDVVAYFVVNKPVKGKSDISHTHENVTWYFSNEENRNLFIQKPSKFIPQYGAHCAMAMSIGKIVDASPLQWNVVNDKLYLNKDAVAYFLWNNLPDRTPQANENWKSLF